MTQSQLNQQWRARVEDFKASGQTMKIWCSAQGLTVHQLKYWLRKTSSPVPRDGASPTNKWITLPVSKDTVEPLNSSPLVIRIGQSAIEVRKDFDAALLRQVVRALEISC